MAGVDATPATARRVALIGLNARAERLLIPGLLAAGNCALTALCSRSAEKAQAIALLLRRRGRGWR